MAAKNLTSEEMIQVSGSWLAEGTERNRALMAVPLLSPSIPLLTKAHTTIAALIQPSKDPRLLAIVEEETRLDARHDIIIRSVHGVLTSTAELVGGAEGDSLIEIRDLVLPDGLASQLKSYRAEAGQAAQLAVRLTPAVRAQTDAIRIGSKSMTLTSFLVEWIGLGLELGKLEDEKGTLTSAKQTPLPNGAVVSARNQWGRVVNAMVANAALAGLDATTEALIFGPLVDAEKRADERARSSSARRKTAADKAEAAKAAADEAAAKKAAEDHTVLDKLVADQGPAAQAALATAAQYKAALDTAAADKTAADKAAAYKVATEQAAQRTREPTS